MKNFKKIEKQYESDESERYLRSLSKTFFISVLYRLTGFGHWEWETAIIKIMEDNDPRKHKRGKWDDREMFVVAGDHREILDEMTEEEIMNWYSQNSHKKNSMGTFLDTMIKLI